MRTCEDKFTRQAAMVDALPGLLRQNREQASVAVQAVAGVAKVKGVRDSVVNGRSVLAPCP